MNDILQLGRRRANPDANINNFFKLTDSVCDCGTTATCVDVLSATTAAPRTIVSFTWDGQVIALPTPPSVANAAAVKAAIEAALIPYEVGIYVEAVYAAGDLTVRHYGQGEITLLTLDNATTITRDERACNVITLCAHEGDVVGTLATVGNGTSTQALAGSPFPFTGNSATDAAEAATLQTQVAAGLTALGVAYTAVTVTVNPYLGVFHVKVTGTAPDTIIEIGSTRLIAGSCMSEFDMA